MRAPSHRALVIGLFGASMAVAGLIFALLLVSVNSLEGDDQRAQDSSDLVSQSSAVELSVVDLETGLRGYLLTGQSRYLQPLNTAKRELPGELRELRRLGRVSRERDAIARIDSGVTQYVRGWVDPFVSHAATMTPAARSRETLLGRTALSALRSRFSALNRSLRVARERQQAGAQAGASRATLAASVGLGTIIGLLALLATYFLRRLLAPMRVVADAAGELAAGDLDIRVPETGGGEVSELARSFNAMAASLSQSQEQMRRAVIAAEEASSMKSDFLANMSHEIRTPLNGVIGMVTLLEKTGLTTEQTDYVATARSSSEALLSVVSDVLDIAKIEAGRLEIEDREFHLHEMVEAAADLVAASALSKGLELQPFIHPDVPRIVRGDRTRLGQVLANLLSNAVKFTEAGEVALEVTAIDRHDDAVTLRCEVRDTGMGIAPGQIERLFEPFAQAEVGTTRTHGGTGLGLTISAELLALMGGTIAATSTVGTGSTFRVEIPLGVSARGEAELEPTAVLDGVRVLILDDNATNRRIFGAYVASWGMRSAEAGSAREAFELLQLAAGEGDPFGVALLDLNLPDESGLVLARRITATPALASTQLILLTSSAATRAASESDTGIRQQLTKPVRQSRLHQAITAVLDRRLAPRGDGSDHPDQPETRVALNGARILVADDHPVNRVVVTRLLEQRGHRVTHAVNGQDALEKLERGSFDLVLMDCQMLVLDGYDATREIRRREAAAGGPRLAIVAMTANALIGARDACLAAGMDDYVSKPFAERPFDEMLSRWLATSSAPVPSGPHTADAVAGSAAGVDDEQAESVLDRERFGGLLALFAPEEIPGMLDELMADLRTEIASTRTAQSTTEMAAAVHRIKNGAGVLGAMALLAESSRIEAAVRANPETDADMAANALDRQRARLESAIGAALQRDG